MTRRVILHVGPHKTASTYLQCRLLLARAELLAQGFDYPEYGLAQFAHHGLYYFLHERTQAISGITEAALRQALAGDANLILSSENFVYLEPRHLGVLKALLPDCRFEVIYYLRHPAQLWPSHWQELVKHGRDVTFLEYLGAQCGWTDVLDPDSENPVSRIAGLAACFGPQSLRILCLDNIAAAGDEVFAHFWRHVLGLRSPVPQSAVPPLNPSLATERVEMLRCLNRRHLDIIGTAPGETVMQRYNAHVAEIEAMPRFGAFRDGFMQSGVPITLDASQPVIRQRERALLARFGARIENRAGPDRIFAVEEIASRTLSADRHWPSRYGFAGFVDQVLERILPPDQLGLPP